MLGDYLIVANLTCAAGCTRPSGGCLPLPTASRCCRYLKADVAEQVFAVKTFSERDWIALEHLVVLSVFNGTGLLIRRISYDVFAAQFGETPAASDLVWWA